MSAVRDYYDRNTWKFLLSGGGALAIHRELWGPGVTSRRAALDHAHARILTELDALGPAARRVLDLGCGVGAACLYLTARRPIEAVGVSLSPVQVGRAERLARARTDAPGRCRYLAADFEQLPAELVGFDLGFAIESFVHAGDAVGFFAAAAAALRPGGRLLVLDDFLTGAADDPLLDDVRAGWLASNLVTVAAAERHAAAAGLALIAHDDLSPLQRLGRPRDRLIAALQPVLRRAMTRSRWAQSLVGGDALQRAHRRGLIEYRLLRFERRAASA